MIEKGSWGENLSWELWASDKQPDASLCTAVFCVAIDSDDKIVLMRAERGWGMLGGHIEAEETLLDALERESIEEGGFIPDEPHLFAHRKITATEPIADQVRTSVYPFPVSYILYYWATTSQDIGTATGSEVLESRSFSLEEIRQLNIFDAPVIETGIKAWKLQSRQKTS